MYLEIQKGIDSLRNESHDDDPDAQSRTDILPVLGDIEIAPEEDSVSRIAPDVTRQPIEPISKVIR